MIFDYTHDHHTKATPAEESCTFAASSFRVHDKHLTSCSLWLQEEGERVLLMALPPGLYKMGPSGGWGFDVMKRYQITC
jgi:hypothetical protein